MKVYVDSTFTTINSGDMAGIMKIAIQAMAKRNPALQARLAESEWALGLTQANSLSLSFNTSELE